MPGGVRSMFDFDLAPPAHDSNPWTRTLTGALILTTTSAAMTARLDSQLLATFGPAVLACLLACYGCFYLHNSLDLFKSVRVWQVTIITMLVSPIVLVARLNPGTLVSDRSLQASWILATWCIRSFSVTRFSVGMVGFQLFALYLLDTASPLGQQRIFTAFTLANLLLPSGFWLAIWLCVTFDLRTKFHPIDPHLRAGLHHVLASRDALIHVARELTLHGLMQACVALSLVRGVNNDGDAGFGRWDFGAAFGHLVTGASVWVVCWSLMGNTCPYAALPAGPVQVVAFLGFATLKAVQLLS